MRTENVDVMRKTFWGGGTVSLASSATDFHVLKCRPSDKFEDGTVAFLDIISLQHGFDFLRKTLGGVTAVHDHVHSLTRHAYERLAALKHTNGAPMLTIFGAHDHQEPEAVQGGIINFEVLDCDGELVSYRTVEKEAADAGFHIRAGVHHGYSIDLLCFKTLASAARSQKCTVTAGAGQVQSILPFGPNVK
jgi:molybdenum cofactor sulfurtransferase